MSFTWNVFILVVKRKHAERASSSRGRTQGRWQRRQQAFSRGPDIQPVFARCPRSWGATGWCPTMAGWTTAARAQASFSLAR